MKAASMHTDENVLALSEAECAARLAPLWVEADTLPFWPARTADVNGLLRSGGGFDVTEGLLKTWARSQQVGTVPIRSGRFAWNPSNVLLAAGLSNACRRWVPGHSAHVHKLSGPELAEQQAAAVGETIFTDLDTVDFRSLVGVVSSTNDPALRSCLCVALLAKLRKAGIE